MSDKEEPLARGAEPAPPAEPRPDGVYGPTNGSGYGGYGYGSYGYGGLPLGPDSEGIDFRRYLRAFHKHRWIALMAFVIVMTAGVLYSYTTVAVYEARVRVLVEAQQLNLVKVDDVLAQAPTADAEVAVLQSRWLAKKTLQSLHKVSDQSAAGETPAEAQQIGGFLGGLVVQPPVEGSGVLDIKYRSADPALAATYANAHAREYIAQKIEVRFTAAKEVADWLAARLTEQRVKLDNSEYALLNFRQRNGLIDITGAPSDSPALARGSETAAAITRAKTARFEKEAVYNRLRSVSSQTTDVEALPPSAVTPQLREASQELGRLRLERVRLSEKLQNGHPEMVKLQGAIRTAEARLQTETGRMVDVARDDLQTAQAAEASLEKALDEQKQTAMSQNQKGVELGILTREVESNKQIYEMLSARGREISLAKEINPTTARILDPALVPTAPISPNRRQDLLRALFAGLVFAVIVALGADYADDRIKGPDDIKKHLSTPFLGFVPEVHKHGHVNGPPLVTNGAGPQFLEAFRSLRTSLLFSSPEDSTRCVVFTSAGSGEGKTTLCTNLAASLAVAGQRVLLIDADMRRPGVHTLLDLPREPGLSNVLVGDAKLAAAIRKTAVPDLWLLPSGHQAPNPPELLGSDQFRGLIAACAKEFDWVLIDAPPVMPVTDACVVAHAVGGVLFVIGAEMVKRNIARYALDQLGGVRAKVVGAVLNHVDLEHNAYYYSPYYHRKDREYYTHPSPPSKAQG
jgi:capsular exopolysaccharide synthesis family protein